MERPGRGDGGQGRREEGRGDIAVRAGKAWKRNSGTRRAANIPTPSTRTASYVQELTPWSAVGLAWGLGDRARPRHPGPDEPGRPDHGLGRPDALEQSPLFEPLNYNYGAVWPFLTGWVAAALFEFDFLPQGYQRPDGQRPAHLRQRARDSVTELFSGASERLAPGGRRPPGLLDDRSRPAARPGPPRARRRMPWPERSSSGPDFRPNGTAVSVSNWMIGQARARSGLHPAKGRADASRQVGERGRLPFCFRAGVGPGDEGPVSATGTASRSSLRSRRPGRPIGPATPGIPPHGRRHDRSEVHPGARDRPSRRAGSDGGPERGPAARPFRAFRAGT